MLRRSLRLAGRSFSTAAAPPASGSLGRSLVATAAAGCLLAAALHSDHPVLSDASFAASALAPPLLRLLDAERAHKLAVEAAALGLLPRERRADPPSLRVRLWGLCFANPLGLAAGFDKDAEGVDALLDLGFGFVEVGSVTPKAQPGNPQPRVWRLPEARAVVNAYGFNSKGLAAAEAKLLERRKQARRSRHRASSCPRSPPLARSTCSPPRLRQHHPPRRAAWWA